MSDSPKAYAIDAAEGVTVLLDDSSEDDTFSLSVCKDGAELESHSGVTCDSVVGLTSEHFTATHVEPPTPEASADADEA